MTAEQYPCPDPAPAGHLRFGQSPQCRPSEHTVMFLGTGAADWPNPAATLGFDGSSRACSSLLAGRGVLIDPGPHVLTALRRANYPFNAINTILLTHTHSDHCDSETIEQLANCSDRTERLRFYGHLSALARLERLDSLDYRHMTVGQTLCDDGVEILALEAHHGTVDPTEVPMHYVLRYGGVSVLYATDGAWLLKSTWDHLCAFTKSAGKPLDIVIMDATIGDGFDGDPRIFEHNNLNMVRIMASAMRNMNVVGPNTPILLTHLARTLHPDHKTLQKALLEQGDHLIAACDGMIISATSEVSNGK